MRRFIGVVLGFLFSGLVFSLAFGGASLAATYTVQPGDTFYLIAQQYGITSDQLMAANGFTGSDLAPGQVMTIPSASQYAVAPGDSLYLIAQQYGTTVDSLIATNHLYQDPQGNVTIYPGQLLSLSGSGGPDASGSGGAAWTGQYTVRPGDTLDQIAQQYGTTADAIISNNNLPDAAIDPGQVLLVPDSANADGTSNVSNNHPASRYGLNASDTYLLAQLINAEAGAEPFEGQVAVGAVVLNRLLDPNFPKTIKDIIFQYDGSIDTYQFEPVLNGAIYEPPCPSAIRAAYAALTGWDPTGGALYFYNPQKEESSFFDSCLTFIKQIGNHLFYK